MRGVGADIQRQVQAAMNAVMLTFNLRNRRVQPLLYKPGHRMRFRRFYCTAVEHATAMCDGDGFAARDSMRGGCWFD